MHSDKMENIELVKIRATTFEVFNDLLIKKNKLK
jgi:hypothetical protein